MISNDKKYFEFLESMHVMAVITDNNFNIIYSNKATLRETGYELSDLIGNKPDIFKSGNHSDVMYKNLKNTVKNGSPWFGKLQNKKKNGQYYWEKATIFPFELDGQMFYGKTAINITREQEIVSENQDATNIAKSIQHSLLPHDLYNEGIIIKGFFQPFENVSGDIYDWFQVDDGVYGVFLADVVGHGVGSALLTTSIVAIINGSLRQSYMPNEFLHKLNNRILDLYKFKDHSLTAYFTVVYLVIDTNEQKIHFSNCGHPPFIKANRDYKISESMHSPNLPLGMFENSKYMYETIDYNPGDKILLYTDGLSDLYRKIHPDGNVIDEMEKFHKSEYDDILHYIESNLFKGNYHKIHDDISMVSINLIE